ncbi:transcriptional regulator [Leisingera methylohalidivorans]|uniref:Transcriptional regulator n=1 Tax=Leisingera methylohalidivorans DSM 14336 TaxID=999552 RepID=V9VXX4_9RHOB|nr:transcriptional regulator [Leisingera methylohalidivorans]AHD01732.1 transcriptional regulator [Leisingera methylohalidivorans DSM 14336]
MTVFLRICRFGAFGVFHAGGANVQLGAKHQALLALLSTADGGIRTRAFLEKTLWCLAQPEQAKASLRTALSTLRRHLGPEAAKLMFANRERVILDLTRVELDSCVGNAVFMEGFELPYETAFNAWLSEVRAEFARGATRSGPHAGTSPGRLIMDGLLPSIAVLPFVHRAPGEASMPLGSLMSEELSRYLSRSWAFSVTSYLASRQFDPETVRPAEVSSIAGVDYLVSGTVSCDGNRFRAEVDLHDTVREKVIWSRSFEGSKGNLLRGRSAVLRNATQQIGQTAAGEAVRLAGFKPLSTLESHTLLMAAISLMQEMDTRKFQQAHEILSHLLEREPKHALPLTWMGFWHVMRVEKGLSPNRGEDSRLASRMAEAAIDAAPGFSLAHTLKGLISSHLTFRFDLAQDAYDLALRDNPNEALALLLKGATLAYQDMPDEAVQMTDAARRLTPLGPQRYYFDALSALAYLSARNFGRAIELSERSLEAKGAFPVPLRSKAIALQMSGRGAEARSTVKKLLKAAPEFCLSQFQRDNPAAMSPAGQEWASALRQAGVPE